MTGDFQHAQIERLNHLQNTKIRGRLDHHQVTRLAGGTQRQVQCFRAAVGDAHFLSLDITPGQECTACHLDAQFTAPLRCSQKMRRHPAGSYYARQHIIQWTCWNLVGGRDGGTKLNQFTRAGIITDTARQVLELKQLWFHACLIELVLARQLLF